MKTDSPTQSTSLAVEPSLQLEGYDRVVVPTDFSAPSMKALHYARAFTSGTIELVHVVPPIMAYDVTMDTLQGDARQAAAEELEAIAMRFRHRAPQVSTSVHLGDPARELAAFAYDWNADLIVISEHARTAAAHFFLGSVTEQLVRRADCPILVVRKHEHDFAVSSVEHDLEVTLQRILVPTDFTPRSREALLFALDFAQRFGGKVTALNVVQVPGAGTLGGLPGVDVVPLAAAAERQARAEMQELVRALPDSALEQELIVPGLPLDVVTRTAVEGKFDLIVCATNSSAVIRHTLLGSTAEAIVRHAYCPVLIVPSRATRRPA